MWLSHPLVPSAPNVTVDQVNSSTLEVFWREPELPNGNITGYYIFYYGDKDGNSRVSNIF